jgi:hypothetical protein
LAPSGVLQRIKRLSPRLAAMDALQRQREQFMRDQFAALAAKKELGEAKRKEKAAKREAEERARERARAAPAMVRSFMLARVRCQLCVACGMCNRLPLCSASAVLRRRPNPKRSAGHNLTRCHVAPARCAHLVCCLRLR